MCRNALPVAVALALTGCGQDGPRIVEADLLAHGAEGTGPYTFRALVVGKTPVRHVVVHWRLAEDPSEAKDRALSLVRVDGGDVWAGELERPFRPDDVVVAVPEGTAPGPLAARDPARPFGLATGIEWWIEAKDGRGQRTESPDGASAVGGRRFGFTIGPWTQPAVALGVNPSRGHADGGLAVLIVGEDLRPDTVFRLGGVELGALEHVTHRLFRGRVPPGPGSQWVDLTATDRQGHELLVARAFYYFADPEPRAVEPDGGPFEGGGDVRITGDHFVDGAAVFVAEAPCRDVRFAPAEPHPAAVLTCRVPAYPGGPQPVPVPVAVRVVNPDGLEGALPDAYTYRPPPRPRAVTPDTGPSDGGTVVLIDGTGFQGPVTVLFDGVPATGCRVIDISRIECVAPSGELGPADVLVRNADGQEGVLPAGYVYHRPAPAPERVVPFAGPDDGGQDVEVLGRFFQPGARVWFDGVPAVCELVTAERLSCVTPASAGPGLVDVVVVNPDDRAGIAEDAYHYVGPPEIHDVVPGSGSIDGGTIVEIRGRYLDGTDLVRFGGAPATVIGTRDDDGDGLADVVTVRTPAHDEGFVDVSLRRRDGEQAVAPRAFEYFIPPPELFRIDPPDGGTWGGTSVFVHGRHFRGGLSVLFAGNRAPAVEVQTDRVLRVVTPPGAEGPADVHVVLATGEAGVFERGFRYVLPDILPDGGLTAGFTNAVVTGRDFVAGARVLLGGVELDATYEDAQTLRVVTDPRAGTGAEDLTVMLPDRRTDSRRGAFTYRELVEVDPGRTLARGDCNDAAAADLDLDGLPDLVLATGGIEGISFALAQVNVLLFNEGGLRFRTVYLDDLGANDTTNVDHGDVDGDGDIDLVEANLNFAGGVPAETRLLLNDGAGTFEPAPADAWPPAPAMYDASFTDVDLDGDLDVFMADNVLRERLYLGDGAGRFTDASAGVPDDAFNNDHDHDLEMADLTGDGLPEAILAVDNVHNGPGGGLYRGSNRVLRNLGGGRFERLRVPELDEMLGDMLDVDAVDIDGDGDRDLLVANSGRPSRLLMNDGAGGFSAAPPGMFETDSAGTFEVSAGDVDGDGDLDLAVANFSLSSLRPGEANRLFVNDGTGRMHDADASWPESRLNSTDVVFEDFDGDGVAELFVCNFDGESILLRQVPAP